ncbi:3-hydroxy acyl-CoA dehydratase [Cryptococcus neoformans Ze90-1]|nr:3-hydroxy acyl-CoA dehydratase [Cryptococcus neoformans var. grubii Ze90-1]
MFPSDTKASLHSAFQSVLDSASPSILARLSLQLAAMPHVAAPSRQALEQERLHRHAQQPGSSLSPAPRLSPLRLYLLGYNILSALLWGHLLVLTLSFLLAPSRPPWHQLADRLSGSYDYHSLGWCTKWTQTLAVLEVVHAALGWVRSPLGTVASQVASRLWTVWGVVEAAPEITHGHPLFTTMLLAWSLTEVIRYSFYALSLLSVSAPFLNYLRYTTFIPLYPLGASSEAFLSFATLPALAPVISRAVTNVMAQAPREIMKTKVGREVLWWSAKHGGGTAGAQKEWGWIEIVRAGLFLLWWPALYVLYTYMLKQRRKVLGKGKTVGGVSKAQ